jgi:hypothetical protein
MSTGQQGGKITGNFSLRVKPEKTGPTFVTVLLTIPGDTSPNPMSIAQTIQVNAYDPETLVPPRT